MLIAFELTMPGRNSWDGKWSGEDRCYVIVKGLRKPPELRSYGYNFGDGWYARVAVFEVSPTTARKLRKQSNGFCGYDWMVDSIIRDGAIYASADEKPEVKALGTGADATGGG